MKLNRLAPLALLLAATGCTELNEVRDALDTVNNGVDTVKGIGSFASGLSLAGVTPAQNYRENGAINFAMLPTDDGGAVHLANLQEAGMKVEVENEDGTYSDCEYEKKVVTEGTLHHTVAVLLDGSGSMELAYPPLEYGDLCPTCPHDPARDRIDAAQELIKSIHEGATDSPIAVAEFGPAPSPQFRATLMHHDFGTETDALLASVNDIRGYEPLGTPLYDSLAELIDATDYEAEEYKDALARTAPDGEEIPVRRHIVVLSDGQDNESELYHLDSVIDLAREHDVAIFVVGLGPASASADPERYGDELESTVRQLQQLAGETGGLYASVDDPSALRTLYRTLGQALTEGYQTETYECVPKPTHDTPEEDCEVPRPGARVNGRVSMGAAKLPWSLIAP